MEKVLKKRGRKPKGGKIVDPPVVPIEDPLPPSISQNEQSVILHLKCFLHEITDTPALDEGVESYNFSNTTMQCAMIDEEGPLPPSPPLDEKEPPNKKSKILSQKLKTLEYDLHTNNVNKRSACFWCTYDFEHEVVNIPKKIVNNSYQVYGCFCSPECATAYLMSEHIDSSTRFERYSILNHMYGKVNGYSKNIKPAPSPFHMLDKYYGNLTIQEYRSLFHSDRIYLTMEKPLTRILPEFHEDNDDFIITNKIIPSNFQASKVKKKYNDRFGMLSF